ncbi:MAG: alpha-glucuronidase family glycosyl hydrolase, partial [Bryobacteraceae bacterium]
MKVLIGAAILITLLSAGLAGAAEVFLVRNGQPEAVIVPGGGEFNGFVAKELQQHIETLSGARLEIVATAPKGKPLVLVGSNTAATGLKEGGYVLKRTTRDGQPALVVSGKDEAGTMYAAYDLLERLGFVFLLTKDIVPKKQIDVRM